jgi:signal transduction histidine kinase
MQVNALIFLVALGMVVLGLVEYRAVVLISNRYEAALDQSSTALVKLNQIQAVSDEWLSESISVMLLEVVESPDPEVVADLEEEVEELAEADEELGLLVGDYQAIAVDPALASTIGQARQDLNRTVGDLLLLLEADTWTDEDIVETKEALEDLEETIREAVDAAITLEVAEAQQAESAAQQASTQAVQIALLTTAALVALVLGLGNWIVNRILFRPVMQLQQAAMQLQRGSWEVALPPQSNREFTTLANSFNQMAVTLQQRDDQLRQLNQDLEGQVAQRTAELEAKVQQLNTTMRFRDEFLAVMSHELRTPMNAIMGYSSFVLLRDNLEEDIKKLMERILVNSESLLALINSILDISRINSGRIQLVKEPFALRGVLHGLADDFRRRAEEKGLSFVFEQGATVPESAIGDSERLSQIVNNLLVNAIKFTDTGEIRYKTDYRDGQLQVSVQDTGIGIPETWQSLIFEEFRQVDMSSKRVHQGAGLGLSVVQKLANLMGGQVRVESAVDIGSTFYVQIPLVPIAKAGA